MGAPDLRPYETRLRDICMMSSPAVRTLPGHGNTTSAAGGVAGAADKRTVNVTSHLRRLLLATCCGDGTRTGNAGLGPRITVTEYSFRFLHAKKSNWTAMIMILSCVPTFTHFLGQVGLIVVYNN